MPDTKQILKVLRDDLALQTRHCKVLEAQELALLTCNRALFAQTQEQHAALVAKLEVQDAARRAALVDDDGQPLTLSGLKEIAPQGSLRGLGALEDGLKHILDQVQALTRRNRSLIQNELDYIAFSLDLFVEAGRTAGESYGGSKKMSSRLLMDRRA